MEQNSSTPSLGRHLAEQWHSVSSDVELGAGPESESRYAKLVYLLANLPDDKKALDRFQEKELRWFTLGDETERHYTDEQILRFRDELRMLWYEAAGVEEYEIPKRAEPIYKSWRRARKKEEKADEFLFDQLEKLRVLVRAGKTIPEELLPASFVPFLRKLDKSIENTLDEGHDTPESKARVEALLQLVQPTNPLMQLYGGLHKRINHDTLPERICNRWLQSEPIQLSVWWRGLDSAWDQEGEVPPDTFWLRADRTSLPLVLARTCVLNARNLKVCSNPDCSARFFIGTSRQKYCDNDACVRWAQRLFKRTWWAKNGKKLRKQKRGAGRPR